MTDRNTSTLPLPIPLARRSSLPLSNPIPTYPPLAASGRASPPRPKLRSGVSTSPILFRDSTFPLRDHHSGHAAMSSSSSSTSSHRDAPSTAPTTPQLGEPSSSRTWRPTPNVPEAMHRRHRQNPLNDSDGAAGGSGDRNRWLSDGEGTGDTNQMAGRRKRRGHRSSDRPTDGYGSSGGGGGAGTSTIQRPTTGRTKTKPPDRQSAFDFVSQSKRPIARRAISMEMGSDPPAAMTEAEVGANPPRIQDLLPPPSSPVAIARGLESGVTTTYTTHVQDDPADRPPDIPDFAPARGVDGIGGHDKSTGSISEDRQRKQKDTLDKLRVILAW